MKYPFKKISTLASSRHTRRDSLLYTRKLWLSMGAPIFDRKECLEYLLLLSKSKDPQSAKAASVTDIQLSLDRDGPLGVKSVV